MSKSRFEFRFKAVKQNLDRQKKMAEIDLMKCRENLRDLQHRLNVQQNEFERSAKHWSSLMSENPAVSFASHDSFKAQKMEQNETTQQIEAGMQACREAELMLARAEQRLQMLEEIETTDREEFDSELRLQQANTFRDEILSNWNRNI